MIKSIEFQNFRNLNSKYEFNSSFNVLIGKNNSGKSNLLDGIKLAFSLINDEIYFKVKKSDFKESDDNSPIIIKVELFPNSIPSLNVIDEYSNNKCGFIVKVNKISSGKYKKTLYYLNESPNIDRDILITDDKIPSIYEIPFIRNKDILIDGLTTGISNFIENDKKYEEIKEASKAAIKNEIKEKEDIFRILCSKFNQTFEVAFADAKLENEKVYVIEEGGKEHNYNIGAGYKSIANIILNTMQKEQSIILIDEIENHLHPALIRTLLRELARREDLFILMTTHSAVVINEVDIESIIDISSSKLSCLDDKIKEKLNIFLHAGRAELLSADNVVLVEGYTEELLLKYYLKNNNWNITIVNVAGVMFMPYIEIAHLLNKQTIVISDNDKVLSDNGNKSDRFIKLEKMCKKYNYKLIEVENTLETDLYNNGYMENILNLLEDKNGYMVSKKNKKTEIVEKLIDNKINLDNWHVIKEIKAAYESN